MTDEEYKQLEENILEDGEVYEPIVVWNDTILDGHNRWNIICDHWDVLGNKYTVKQMDFPDKWAAFEWMYKKQLGRRNLTEEQKTTLRGKMYESRKKSRGAPFGNENAKKQKAQNELIENGPNKAAREIANELGIGVSTVKRAYEYSQGIDALAGVSKEASDKVLEGRSGTNKKTIMEFPKLEPEKQQEIVDAILSGEIKSVQKRSGHKGWTKEDRESRALTESIVAEMYSPELKPYTIEMLEEEIELNGQSAINVLRQVVLIERIGLVTEDNIPRIVSKIDDIIREFNAIKKKVSEMK